MSGRQPLHPRHKMIRLALAAVVGTAAALVVPTPPSSGVLGRALLGFAVTALAFALPLLHVMMRADAAATRELAHGIDAGRSLVDVSVLVASLASLGGVGLMLLSGHTPTAEKATEAGLAIATVASAWVLVPTVYAMRYARHWFNAQSDCIDLHQDEPPRYSDFVYLAFTVAMSYAVSDTDLKSSEIRAIAIRQAWLAYVFGTVIIAASINLIAGLAA